MGAPAQQFQRAVAFRGDEWCGAAEHGYADLVLEADTGDPDGCLEKLGMDGRVNGLPDAEKYPSECRNQNVDAEYWLVQQQEQG